MQGRNEICPKFMYEFRPISVWRPRRSLLKGHQMATAKPRAKTPARRARTRGMISRTGLVSDWGGSLFILAERHKGSETRRCLASLDLRGSLKEAVKGVTDYELTLSPSDDDPGVGKAEIASLGCFIATKPVLRGIVSLSRLEFDLVIALAVGGKLRQIAMYFQEPRYGSALIASFSVSCDALE